VGIESSKIVLTNTVHNSNSPADPTLGRSFDLLSPTEAAAYAHKVSLKALEHVELMLALDRLGNHRRIETIGLNPCQLGNHTGLGWDLE
jgi:hypothetical protein